MTAPPAPYPDYLITLVGPGSGAGAGVPGAAVRDAATGRVIDRLPGRMYAAVAGTASNRVFFLTGPSSWERATNRAPGISQIPPGGAIRVQLNDDGTVAGLAAVPDIPEPGSGRPGRPGPADLAATADGSTVAFPARHQRGGPPAPPGTADVSPAQVHLVAVATGEHTSWQAGSDGSISHLSLSADGHRMAFSWHGAGGDNGIRVVDLPGTATGPICTTPSLLVIAEQNGLGNLGQAVISPDGASIYLTAARYGPGGQPVTRLAEVSVADGELRGIAYERRGADPGNMIFGWGSLAIDPAGQHALIAYSGNLGRIDLSTGQLTELPIEENGAFDIAW